MQDNKNSSLSEHLELEALASAIQHAVQETIFSSGLRISPRRTVEVSRSLAKSFFDFYDDREQESVTAKGMELAAEGLSSQSLLAATEAVRLVCTTKSNPLEDLPGLAGVYANTLALGFIEGREHMLLEQQQRIHEAFIRARGPESESP